MQKLTEKESELLEKAHAILGEFTGHAAVRLMGNGNGAIFAALALAKDAGARRVLIPDQGGWFSYKTFPLLLDLEIVELPTDAGVLDPEVVEEALSKNKDMRSVLLIPSFAGYYAEQNIAELAAACHEGGGLIIEDASGSLSDDVLCSSQHADYIVASFGYNKLVNLGYGGMLSTKFGLEKEHSSFTLSRFHPSFLEKLLAQLDGVKKRLSSLLSLHRKILKELNAAKVGEILHPDKRGMNVLLSCTGQGLQEAVAFCKKRSLPFLELPRYHRAKIKGISIEVKRLSEVYNDTTTARIHE